MAKTKLKYVGAFAELGYDDDPSAPTLALCRGKRKPDHKREVVAYLRSAVTLIFSPGSHEDVFDPSKSAGSSSIATDGVYLWPRAVAYYVDKYDVELPQEFEAHMARCHWTPPSAIDKRALDYSRD